MILTKTPYRLSFFGGGTDYNAWFEKNGGLVIGSAINKYCYISVRKLPPFFDHKTRLVYSKIEAIKDHSSIQHRGIASCFKYLNVNESLEIHHDGDLPARSGIGSSSSFTVGLILALRAMRREMISKKDLAEQAIEVEQNVACENVGIQDQILTTYGGLQIITMGPGKKYSVDPLILPPDYEDGLESHVLLAFTGLTRISSQKAGKQIEAIKAGGVDSKMLEIQAIAHEALTLFKRNADYKMIGELLDKSWQVKRSITQQISSDEIDQIYETAKRAGAYGGKLLGAGGGGFFMFLAPPWRHERIKEALKRLKVWVPFGLDKQGAQITLYDGDQRG